MAVFVQNHALVVGVRLGCEITLEMVYRCTEKHFYNFKNVTQDIVNDMGCD